MFAVCGLTMKLKSTDKIKNLSLINFIKELLKEIKTKKISIVNTLLVYNHFEFFSKYFRKCIRSSLNYKSLIKTDFR